MMTIAEAIYPLCAAVLPAVALVGAARDLQRDRPHICAIRLVAFLLIIVGMIDKNRSRQ